MENVLQAKDEDEAIQLLELLRSKGLTEVYVRKPDSGERIEIEFELLTWVCLSQDLSS